MDLLIRYSYLVGGTARPDIVVVQYRFHATPCLNNLRKLVETILERSTGRIYSYGPYDQVLVSGRWCGPTGPRGRAVPIPRYYM